MIRRAELLKEVKVTLCLFPHLVYTNMQAIDDWVFKTQGLRALLLTEEDWKTLGEIADILEVRCWPKASFALLTSFC
jgi:hypothetical protein